MSITFKHCKQFRSDYKTEKFVMNGFKVHVLTFTIGRKAICI